MARAPLEVVTARHYWQRIKWLSIGVGAFALLGLGNAIREPMMLLPVAMMASGPLLLVWARRYWVQRFDEHGVTLRNGRAFAWQDFKYVEVRKSRRMINHYDLVFSTGRAGVYYRMAENVGEVMEVIRAIEDGRNPFLS